MFLYIVLVRLTLKYRNQLVFINAPTYRKKGLNISEMRWTIKMIKERDILKHMYMVP